MWKYKLLNKQYNVLTNFEVNITYTILPEYPRENSFQKFTIGQVLEPSTVDNT